MGSSPHKDASKVVSVGLDKLKEQLNVLYKMRKNSPCQQPDSGLFDHLWDLKELAILEGKSSVEVPKTWLDELNEAIVQLPQTGLRTH